MKYIIITLVLISSVSHAGWLSDRLTPPKKVRDRLKPPKEIRKLAEDLGNFVVEAPKALVKGIGDAVTKAPDTVNGLITDVPKAGQQMYDGLFKDNYQGLYKTVDSSMQTFKNLLTDVVTLGQYTRDKETKRAEKELKKAKDDLEKSQELLDKVDDDFVVGIITLYANLKVDVTEYIKSELSLYQFKSEYQKINEKLLDGSINVEASNTYFLELKKLFKNPKFENQNAEIHKAEKLIDECIHTNCKKLNILIELRVNSMLLNDLRETVLNAKNYDDYLNKIVTGEIINDYIFENERNLDIFRVRVIDSLIKLKRVCGSFDENKVTISDSWAAGICDQIINLKITDAENVSINELFGLPSVLSLKGKVEK